ncbi:MAG TPA: bifunctional riboflavin kinase/FAD synthetase [bacterium (Candidatus Stahlbacteria)]|nr:bifunctional riboflavin kinase/FAD synthetase [Candidatus Stahlbacteria bacterium]
MKVFYSIDETEGLVPPTAFTMGTFDGIHVGHQAVIREVTRKGNGMVLSFDPNPKEVLLQEKFALLTNIDEKKAIFEQMGVSYLLIMSFDRNIANMQPDAFIEWLHTHIKFKEFIIGYNHRFGRGRSGDFELLSSLGEKLGFKIKRVPLIMLNGAPVSSTRVRNLLGEGKVATVKELLGRYYSFTGEVIPGANRGRTLAYPTANLKVEEKKLLPKDGVYAVIAELDNEKYNGIMDIGTKPTFGDKFGVEIHLFDFNKNILGTKMKVECVNYIRENIAFPSPEALKDRIRLDEIKAREILKHGGDHGITKR